MEKKFRHSKKPVFDFGHEFIEITSSVRHHMRPGRNEDSRIYLCKRCKRIEKYCFSSGLVWFNELNIDSVTGTVLKVVSTMFLNRTCQDFLLEDLLK